MYPSSVGMCKMESLSRNLFYRCLSFWDHLCLEATRRGGCVLEVKKVLWDCSPKTAAGRIPLLESLKHDVKFEK